MPGSQAPGRSLKAGRLAAWHQRIAFSNLVPGGRLVPLEEQFGQGARRFGWNELTSGVAVTALRRGGDHELPEWLSDRPDRGGARLEERDVPRHQLKSLAAVGKLDRDRSL